MNKNPNIAVWESQILPWFAVVIVVCLRTELGGYLKTNNVPVMSLNSTQVSSSVSCPGIIGWFNPLFQSSPRPTPFVMICMEGDGTSVPNMSILDVKNALESKLLYSRPQFQFHLPGEEGSESPTYIFIIERFASCVFSAPQLPGNSESAPLQIH